MAEITKISTPLVPKENVGNKFKPNTDQAFEITDPSKIHKPAQEGKIFDQRTDSQALRDSMGKAAIASLLKDTNDLANVIKRLALLIETGISTSEVMDDPQMKLMLGSAFVAPDELMDAVREQDQSAVLFKGEAFDVLRDLLSRFPDNPKIRETVANLLKAFECNVNSQQSVRTILMNCENILDYLFSKDKAQFSDYLDGLTEAILPKQPNTGAELTGQTAPHQAAENTATSQTQQAGTTGQDERPVQSGQAPQTEQIAQGEQIPQSAATPGQPVVVGGAVIFEEAGQPASQPFPGGEAASTQASQQVQQQTEAPAMTPKEVAQLLKGNLLPLLGEIVVKYNQNEKIRDHVMVAVHNTVRVDQGTPEALRIAINKLVRELRQVASLPEDFTRSLTDAIFQNSREAGQVGNQIMEKLVNVINDALRSEQSSPATIRQAETLLMSFLQNQSVIMDVLHFVLPIQIGDDQMIAEMYVDPDSENGGNGNGNGKQSRKIFLSFESKVHGAFELSFLESGEYVDFAMWCPGSLVKGLGGMKRSFANMMQTYGYTMNSFSIEEYKRPQSVAEVFPNLLNRRMGIDVRI